MPIPDFRDFRTYKLIPNLNKKITHSAEGSSWKKHKYIKRVDGTYYYPDSYEGGRHLPDDNKEAKGISSSGGSEELTSADIERLAQEVIRGNFGNGQQRKDLLGEDYAEIQKRVNEILLNSPAKSKKVSEATSESIKKAEEAARKISVILSEHKKSKAK